MTESPVSKSSILLKSFERACIGIADGTDFDYKKYENSREILLSCPEIVRFLPDWVFTNSWGSNFWYFIKAKSNTHGHRRNFLAKEFSLIQKRIENKDFIETDLLNNENDYIKSNLNKCRDKIKNNDFNGAITNANSLFESVIKHVLDQNSTSYLKNTDTRTLWKLVQTNLSELDPISANSDLKDILMGLSKIVISVGEFRNKVSDGHGRGVHDFDNDILSRHHALLIVNLVSSVCDFLVNFTNFRK